MFAILATAVAFRLLLGALFAIALPFFLATRVALVGLVATAMPVATIYVATIAFVTFFLKTTAIFVVNFIQQVFVFQRIKTGVAVLLRN